MSGFWDKSNQPSEYEQLEETIDKQAQAILDDFEDEEEEDDMQEDDAVEETMEDYKPTQGKSAYRLDKRENSILTDATIRLEQARLYDMLIKHDLFAGVKANPRALENVQNELKQYIVSRLEILLGIRQEKTNKEQPKQLIVDSPFNDIEIDFLKALSYKGTKGASASAPNKKMIANEIQVLSDDRQESKGLRPMSQEVSPKGLASMQSNEDEDEDYYQEPEKQPRPVQKVVQRPVQKVVQRPVQKTVKESPIQSSVSRSIQRTRRGEMSNQEAEQIALEDLKKNGKGMSKHPYEMTPKELKALATKSDVKKVRPANATPMPTSDQVGMHLQMQQQHQTMNPNNGGFNVILQKVLQDKNK